MSKILIETAPDHIQDVDTVALKSSLDLLVSLINQVGIERISPEQDGVRSLELDEITLAVKVSARGELILLNGTQTSGAMTLKFKRSVPPSLANNLQVPQISYQKLETALAKRHWQEANLETWHLLCATLGKTQGTSLTANDVEQIPCAAINNIDKLWHKYSDGKFGFTVQSRIYKEN